MKSPLQDGGLVVLPVRVCQSVRFDGMCGQPPAGVALRHARGEGHLRGSVAGGWVGW